MASTTDRARRLRLKRLTLRTLSVEEAAQVHGGVAQPIKAGTNSPASTRYCLEEEI